MYVCCWKMYQDDPLGNAMYRILGGCGRWLSFLVHGVIRALGDTSVGGVSCFIVPRIVSGRDDRSSDTSHLRDRPRRPQGGFLYCGIRARVWVRVAS